jgi:dTDP-4-dehydrorhamnose 3,5-epimerase
MRWKPLIVEGSWIIEPEPALDARGGFARILDGDELRARGLVATYAQTSVAWNERAGTLRGLHVALPPAREVKIVRCIRGAAFDVIVDARAGSRTFGAVATVILDERNRHSVYVPAGCAHGYQTLVDDTELCYAISSPYRVEFDGGIRYDDPALGIAWPREVNALSDRDRTLGPLAAFAGPRRNVNPLPDPSPEELCMPGSSDRPIPATPNPVHPAVAEPLP